MGPTTKQLMIRWSIITTGLMVIFWIVWHLVFEKVPIVSVVVVSENNVVNLPFAVTRWWDILITPVYTCLFIFLLSPYKNTDGGKELILWSAAEAIALGFHSVLVALLCYKLDSGFSTMVVGFGLFIAFFYGVISGTDNKPNYDKISWGLGSGLVAGVLVGLCYGLLYGLFVTFATNLFGAMVYGVTLTIKTVSIKIIHAKIWHKLLYRTPCASS